MGTAGERLVERVRKLFNTLGIDCYGNHGQVSLKDLHPAAAAGHHLEIDLVAKIADSAIFIEVTSQQDGNRNKIKRFVEHCNLILSSPKPLKNRLKLFKGIPARKLPSFEGIDEWKYLYIGTGFELLVDTLRSQDFVAAGDRLFIFNRDQLGYLQTLSALIGQWAKYELLSAIKVNPSTLGDKPSVTKPCLRLKGRVVSQGSEAKCDILLLIFTPEELLKAGRVFRYGALTMPLEGTTALPRYQRILIPPKLHSIAKFVKSDARKCFPNTVTLVLRRDQIDYPSDETVEIPLSYSSIDIVDGQHRVLGYGHSSISDRVRQEGKILATALVLQATDPKKANKISARIFWEVNSAQTRVKRDLLYLIKFDVLGDTDAEAIAGEVIRRCNETKKALGGLFRTHPLRRESILRTPAIPIVTVVEELSAFFRKPNGKGLSAAQFRSLYGKEWKKIKAQHRLIIQKVREIVEHYFSIVKTTFEEDWREGSRSALLSSTYLAAFIRLLRVSLIDKGFGPDEINQKLEKLKRNLRPVKAKTHVPTFRRDVKKFPSVKESVKNIFKFLQKRI